MPNVENMGEEVTEDPYDVPVAIELDCTVDGGGNITEITISVSRLPPEWAAVATGNPLPDGPFGDLIGKVVVDPTITTRLVTLHGRGIFSEINGYDCSKDGLEGDGTLVLAQNRWLLDICTQLIVGPCPNTDRGSKAWTNSHHTRLKILFQQITTEVLGPGNSLHEMVFERKIGSSADLAKVATPLIYSIFLAESGAGGDRLAWPAYTTASDIWGIIDAGVAAQRADWGPGGGTRGHEFPKKGSLIIIKKDFYKLLGFNYCTPECTAMTTDYDQYRYKLDTTTYFQAILAAGNQASDVFLEEVGLKENGDPADTPAGTDFILEENLGPGQPGRDKRTATNNTAKNTKINALAAHCEATGTKTLLEIMNSTDQGLIKSFLECFQDVLTKLLGDTNQSIFHFIFNNLLSSEQLGKFCIGKCTVDDIRRQINFRSHGAHAAAIDAAEMARPAAGPYVGGGPIQSGGAEWVTGVGLWIQQNNILNTVDKTVDKREIACGLRSVLTLGGKGLITGTLYTPTESSIQDVLIASLISEKDLVDKSIQTIRESVTRMRADKIFYKITTRQVMYRRFHEDEGLADIFRRLIEWCDTHGTLVNGIYHYLGGLIGATDAPGHIDDLSKFQKAIIDDEWPVGAGDRPDHTPLNLRAQLLPQLITQLPNGQIGYIANTAFALEDPPSHPSIFIFFDIIRELDAWQDASLLAAAATVRDGDVVERAGGAKTWRTLARTKTTHGVSAAAAAAAKALSLQPEHGVVSPKMVSPKMVSPMLVANTAKQKSQSAKGRSFTRQHTVLREPTNQPVSKTDKGKLRIAEWEKDRERRRRRRLQAEKETAAARAMEEEVGGTEEASGTEEAKAAEAAAEEPAAATDISAEVVGSAVPDVEMAKDENFDTFNQLEPNEKYLLYLINIIVENEGKRESFAGVVDMYIIINILYNISIYYLVKNRDVPVAYTDAIGQSIVYKVDDGEYALFRLRRAVIKATSIFFGAQYCCDADNTWGDMVRRLERDLPSTYNFVAIDGGIGRGEEVGRKLYEVLTVWAEEQGGGAPKCQLDSNKVYKSSKKKSIKKKKSKKKTKKKYIKKSPKYSTTKSLKKKSFKKGSRKKTLRKKSKRKSKK